MNKNKCQFILNTGKKCNAFHLKGKKYCFSHDPDNREAKHIAVTKGGLVKDIVIHKKLKDVQVIKSEDVVKLLITTINEVRCGDLDPRIANTIGYLAGHLLKAFEIADLTMRVEKLEERSNG